MISPSSNFSSAILISFLLTLLHFLSLSPTSKATPTYNAIQCPNSSTYSPSSTYETNLNALFSVLSYNSTVSNGFYNFIAGSGTPDVAYGLFLCRGDVSAAMCRDCVDYAAGDVVELCPRSKWATIWYDKCMLRYSDTSIISTMDITLSVMLPGGVFVPYIHRLSIIDRKVSFMAGRFKESLKELMGELATRDSLKTQLGDKKFATGEVKLTANQTLYGLLQCTPDINSADCGTCITAAVSNLPNCCDGKQGGRVMYTSCNVRYETYQFYSLDSSATPMSPPSPPPPPPPPPPSTSGKGGILWRVLVGVTVPIGVIGFCFLCSKRRKKYFTSKPLAGKDAITTLQSLQCDLSTIRAVTNNFSDDNKIGMGGFGPVYQFFWYDECMLHYSDTSIFSTMDITHNVMLAGAENITEQPGQFNESLRELMGKLSTRASLNTQSGDKEVRHRRSQVHGESDAVWAIAMHTGHN
ncbi:hypothetical protein RHMOL_Rhmol13G0213700 [Rhododendron molle]|uniref:Uncharacterized protein n=1 Tax=Rhododendron molle TaxID=49168 RepID=A0ACC0L9C4_RHOML|nr:hypothetical protein RHMOL_Rhmol13G0213700 [Rhododendron molle]